MVKISILYPATPGSRFDFDYYLNVHMPMSIARLGESMMSVEVDRVVDPGPPWPSPTFAAICSFVCESKEVFEAAFLPHMAELQANAPNYTDVQQIVLISEIALDHRAAQAGPSA
jgi:uncharacterized protein (TIGR02118 family)